MIVGDGACGKTCLLWTYAKGEYPSEYVPTVFDDYVAKVNVNDLQWELALWDTAGQEGYDRLRPLAYPGTDIFLISYAVDNPASFNNVASVWLPEIKSYCPKVPYVLVAMKTDLRNDEETMKRLAEKKLSVVTEREGRELAESIGASVYVECSALKKVGVSEVFIETVHVLMTLNPGKPKGCKVQ